MTDNVIDAEFSDVQLKRREVKINKILERVSDNTIESLLIEAYNTGYADAQNETKSTFKLDS